MEAETQGRAMTAAHAKKKNPPKASFQIPHPVEPQRAIRKVLYLNL